MGAARVYAVVCIPLALVAAAVALLKFAPLAFIFLDLGAVDPYDPRPDGVHAADACQRRSVDQSGGSALRPGTSGDAFLAVDPQKSREERRQPADGYLQYDAQLGFAPVPNTVLRYQLLYRPTQEQLFDSHFSIGPNGLR